MGSLHNQMMRLKQIGRCMISCLFVFVAHFALSTIPRFFSASSILSLLSFSALVLLALAGLGKCCRRVLGVSASAPAFVFFNILFVWGVYVAAVRQAISPLMDIAMNAELVLLLIGLCSILFSDPGLVKHRSSHVDGLVEYSVSGFEGQGEELELLPGGIRHEYQGEEGGMRIRYCRICKQHVKGFDHHCPAFGNCIGQKNHVLFVFLLVGFLITEISYIVCCSQFAAESRIFDKYGETNLSGKLAISTMLFSLLQVVWQGVFLAWHAYCVCVNIKTDEWINWKNYPEFRLVVQPQLGETATEIRFRNPYSKGVLRNIKEFLVPD